jgi:hypothetical protein
MPTRDDLGRIAVVAAFAAVAWLSAPAAKASGGASRYAAQDEAGWLHGPFAQATGYVSVLNTLRDQALLASTFGYEARGGYRWRGWGAFALFEQNFWLTTEQDVEVVHGAFNLGIGAEFVCADGFVASSLAMGPSILAFDTALDDAGTVGFFLALRPVGLRWPVHRHLALVFDPISFALVAPVLGGIPLIQVQYRTTFSLEVAF